MPYMHNSLILSGDYAHFYQYNKPIKYGSSKLSPVRRNRLLEKTISSREENIKRSTARSKKAIRLLIESNNKQYNDHRSRPIPTRFITLTFADNIKSIERASYEFKKFIERLTYKIGERLVYLTIPEKQKRGAVHYHCLFFNLPFMDQVYDVISEIWGNGFINFQTLKSDNIHVYLTKYVTKENSLDKNKKRYLSSRNIKRPKYFINVSDKSLVDYEHIKSNTFINDWQYGIYTYAKSNIDSRLNNIFSS